MNRTLSDPAFYVKVSDGQLEGLMGVHVDETLMAGTINFEKITESTLTTFDSKPRTYDNFDFFGSHISTVSPRNFLLSQSKHAIRLQLAPRDCSFETFRGLRAMIHCLTHSRPDLSCAINKAAQLTSKTMSSTKIKEYDTASRSAKDAFIPGLRFGSLDESSLVLKMYADGAFAVNDDLSSQLGYLILLCDSQSRSHILNYSSKKSKRVIRSIMGPETLAFADGYDKALVIRKNFERTLGFKVPLCCFTDSKQLFDAVSKGKQTTEKRLMIDILAARESYVSHDISSIGFILTEVNPADDLRKVKGNGILQGIMTMGVDNCPVENWIIRSAHRSSD